MVVVVVVVVGGGGSGGGWWWWWVVVGGGGDGCRLARVCIGNEESSSLYFKLICSAYCDWIAKQHIIQLFAVHLLISKWIPVHSCFAFLTLQISTCYTLTIILFSFMLNLWFSYFYRLSYGCDLFQSGTFLFSCFYLFFTCLKLFFTNFHFLFSCFYFF